MSQKKYFYGSKCLFIVFTVIIYTCNLLFWPFSNVQFRGFRRTYIVVPPSPQTIHLQNTFVSPKWDSHPLNNNLPFPPPSLWHHHSIFHPYELILFNWTLQLVDHIDDIMLIRSDKQEIGSTSDTLIKYMWTIRWVITPPLSKKFRGLWFSISGHYLVWRILKHPL